MVEFTGMKLRFLCRDILSQWQTVFGMKTGFKNDETTTFYVE
jgi:hypothetical protein